MTTLLIIDPQNDFHGGGSLAVPGADDDARRLATFIRSKSSAIDNIVITMDTHAKMHIAHAAFWKSGENDTDSPPAFSTITAAEVAAGTWVPRDKSLFSWCSQYLAALEKGSDGRAKFQLVVWPEHCLQGSTGHAVNADIFAAVNEWSGVGKHVRWVNKGQNNLTEMYSALAAEVPVPDDTNTHMNHALRDDLLPAVAVGGDGGGGGGNGTTTRLIVAGQAKSHCVNFTLRDIMGPQPGRAVSEQVFLLEDCMSSVAGFEEAAATFSADMAALGIRCTTSTDLELE